MSEEKEHTGKGALLVNRGKAVFHIRPTVKLDKEGKPVQEDENAVARDIAPGEAFHADDEKQAENLLNYHAIGEASEDDPRIQNEIDQHKAEIERLEAELKEQKKPASDKKAASAPEKETSKERENRKRYHRSR